MRALFTPAAFLALSCFTSPSAHAQESFGPPDPVTPAGAGACCLPDLGCTDTGSLAACIALGGIYLDGQSCASDACGVGACCDPDTQNCVNFPVYPCIFNGRTHLGAGTNCADNPCALTDGACCLGTSCDVIPETECSAASGIFFGFGTVCFDNLCAAGACCLPGDCINLQKYQCDEVSGNFVIGGDCSGPEDPCFVPNSCPFDSLAAQSPHQPNNSWEFGSSEASSPFTRYDNFASVPGPIESITFYGVDLKPLGGSNFAECVESDTTFTITFHADAGGVPGDALITFTQVATRTPTGVMYLFAEINQYTFTLPTPLPITQGWISIVGAGDEGCWFLWLSSADGDGSSYCTGCSAQFIDYDLNFCFTGTPGGVTGACCDVAAAECLDNTDIASCIAAGLTFSPNTSCDDLDPVCGVVLGGCCLGDEGCEITEEADCAKLGGDWAGANTTCQACPCLVPCPPGSFNEGEPTCFDGYIDTFNGGCGSDPDVFQPISLGQTVCGTAGVFDTDQIEVSADADWYEVTVNQPTNLIWTVRAEFEPLVFIIDGNNGCPASAITGGAVLNCQTLVIGANVEPGTYWLYISPSAFTDNSACGRRYFATVSAGQTCPGDFDLDLDIDSVDLNVVLASFGCSAGIGACAGDIDGDGDTDSIDLNIVLLNFGENCK